MAATTPLFSYNTLNVSLDKETRSLHLELNRPENNNTLNTEMIFELESLFTWLTGHLEINAVYISGAGENFCQGFDIDELKQLNTDKIKRNFGRLQKVIYSMYFLPQTFVCTLQGEVTGAGAEFALGCDIRLASAGTTVSLNHLSQGLVPVCGGVGFLSLHIPRSIARNWVMTGRTASSHEVENSGFADFNAEAEEILKAIAKQAPVARIQAKRAFLESIQTELEKAMGFEQSIGYAALENRDWERDQFIQARDFGQRVSAEHERQQARLDN